MINRIIEYKIKSKDVDHLTGKCVFADFYNKYRDPKKEKQLQKAYERYLKKLKKSKKVYDIIEYDLA